MNGITCAFTGRIGQDGELRYLPDARAFLTFSVAVDDAKAAADTPAEWVRCTAWGELAESLQNRLVKGTAVYVEGRLKLNTWMGKDRTERQGLNLSAWVVQPIGQVGRRVPKEARQASGRAATRRAVERATAD